MKRRELREALEQLQADIRNLDAVDEASKDLLNSLMGDISDVLERSEEDPGDRHRGLLDRLREATGHFKASHPDLSAVMERAMDTLSNMGI